MLRAMEIINKLKKQTTIVTTKKVQKNLADEKIKQTSYRKYKETVNSFLFSVSDRQNGIKICGFSILFCFVLSCFIFLGAGHVQEATVT